MGRTTSEARQEAGRRVKVNNELFDLTKNRYFESIPLVAIDRILTANGFNETEGAIYCGREGRSTEQVGERTWLALNWYKMEVTGNYEIVAYVS